MYLMNGMNVKKEVVLIHQRSVIANHKLQAGSSKMQCNVIIAYANGMWQHDFIK